MFGPVLLAAVFAAGSAEALDLDPAVRPAVDRACAYLRGRYAQGLAAGTTGGVGSHPLGEAALAGLALLEAGTPPADPAVQQIAAAVRTQCLPSTSTYEVALSVLMLDRLGDPADRGVIQVLGVKLYAGLGATGGWTYTTGEAVSADAVRLLATPGESALRTKPVPAPKAGGKSPDGFVRPPAPKAKGKDQDPATGLHPAAEQYYRQVVAALRQSGRGAVDGDNSNTQFGLIGLWVAARNGLPADDAFALIEARFVRTQNANAGWGYNSGSGSTPSMTCAGLLGLAVGAGRYTATPPEHRRKEPPAGGGGFVPAPKAKDKEKDPPLEGVRNKRAVAGAVAALGTVVQGAPGGRGLAEFAKQGNEYYLLWSMERVCMAYNLKQLGGTDWHAWGCGFLLPAQLADGSWPAANMCSQDVDTCFAVLFLVKSNLTTDLSAKLGDPPERTLKAGGADPPAFAKPAADAEFLAKLAALRDAPAGADNTQALVRLIPGLPADRQAKAREALAQRLGRMKATYLRAVLKDSPEELKRAAAGAMALKADKGFVPDLIAAVADPAEAVTQAARQALQKLTGADHGPQPGADAVAKGKAQEAWRAATKSP